MQHFIYLPLTNVKCHSESWPVTVTSQLITFHQFHDLDTNLDLHLITGGIHGAFAMGVACQQGMLTLQDTWFRPPFWDIRVLMLQLLRPVFPSLPCLSRLFTWNTPRYFLDFAFSYVKNNYFAYIPPQYTIAAPSTTQASKINWVSYVYDRCVDNYIPLELVHGLINCGKTFALYAVDAESSVTKHLNVDYSIIPGVGKWR